MNFAMIGCGMISHIHAAAIREIPEAYLYGAFASDRAGAAQFCGEYGCRLFETQEELLASPAVDVVSVCTPSGFHAGIAIEAMRRGKHVVIEKPMAITPEQAQKLIDAAKQYHRKVCVISQMRTAPAVRFLKDAIDRGVLGKLLFANLSMPYYRTESYYGQSGWRGTWELDGGGALMNQGIHGIDILLHFCGAPASVYGIAKTMVHSIETEDTAGALVEFKSGTIATIHASTSSPPGHPRLLEIFGERGSFVMEEINIIRWDVRDVGLPEPLAKPVDLLNAAKDPRKIRSEGHKTQLMDLIQAVKEDRQPMNDQYEGKKAVELICSIYRSSREGVPVRLI